MNALQLVQTVTQELGLPVPGFLVNNQDVQAIQLLALLNALGYELQREYDWQKLDVEYRLYTQFLITTGNTTQNSAVITNLASTTGLDTTYQVSGTGVNQDTFIKSVDSPTQVTLTQAVTVTGTGATINFGKVKYAVPSDYDRQIDRTQYDKSKRWEMLGNETAQQWQFLKSSYIATGPRIRWRMLGGFFQIWPMVTTAEYLGFEYVSANWAQDINGVGKSSFTADTDTCLFPDQWMVIGLKKKLFEAKGFDATNFTRDFRDAVDLGKAYDSGSPTLSMAPVPSSVLVGYENIPDSNYGL